MENNEIQADEIKHVQNKADVKTITCRRVFNMGNYNTRHLEMVADVPPGVDADAASDDLVRRVERSVRIKVEADKSESDLESKPKPQPAAASTENFDDKPW